MRKLASIKCWIDKRFAEGGGPAESTVRKWCNEGRIPCKRIGGSWFIYIELESNETGNPLVDDILKAG